MNSIPPLVSVVCTAYNHEQYIRDTLNGFILQKVSFPIEIIVHDDASTDGTVHIIREYEKKYPSLFNNIYCKVNKYSQGIDIWKDLFLNVVRGRYIALCEGDDYWTDPNKLQNQIDFLESNKDYGLVYTNYKILQRNKLRLRSKDELRFSKSGDLFENLLLFCFIRTLTVCFRTEKIMELYKIQTSEKLFCGDIFVFLFFSVNYKIKYLSDITGVYRILPISACHFNQRNEEFAFYDKVRSTEHYYYHQYIEKIKCPNRLKMKWLKYETMKAISTGNYEDFRLIKFHFNSSDIFQNFKFTTVFFLFKLKPLFNVGHYFYR